MPSPATRMLESISNSPVPNNWILLGTAEGLDYAYVQVIETPEPKEYKRMLQDLKAWADNLGIYLQPGQLSYIADGRYRVHIRFGFRLVRPNFSNDQWGGGTICPRCRTEFDDCRFICSNCRYRIKCTHCRISGISIHLIDNRDYCINCSARCGICSSLSGGASICADDHPDHFECRLCGGAYLTRYRAGITMVPTVEDESLYATNVCEDCAANVCTRCGDTAHALQEIILDDEVYYVCNSCYRRHYDPLASAIEIEEAVDIDPEHLIISPLPGRDNIRSIGFELEGNGAGNQLARELYDMGLCSNTGIGGYHGERSGVCTMEHDATVDWELIINRFHPGDGYAWEQVDKVMAVMRDHIKSKKVSLNLNCGAHGHIEAKGMGLQHMHNLYNLFCHLEDPIFRIASAKWPCHRSLRNVGHGGPAAPLVKGAFKSRAEFGKGYLDARGSGQTRTYALNFIPYWSGMRAECGCGAVAYGAYEDCSCRIRKPTIEFRVWNATANTRKLHAYAALEQALLAKAITMPDVPRDNFPVFSFIQETWEKMEDETKSSVVEGWKPRLKWMMEELPLSSEEKKDIAYCVMSSDMSELGHDFVSRLVGE